MAKKIEVTQAELDALKRIRLPESTKVSIITLSKQGVSKQEIQRRLGVTKHAVYAVLDPEYREHGKKQSLKYRGIDEPNYAKKARELGLDPATLTPAQRASLGHPNNAERTELQSSVWQATTVVKAGNVVVEGDLTVKGKIVPGIEFVEYKDPVEELIARLTKAKEGIPVTQLGEAADLILEEMDRRGYVTNLLGGRVMMAKVPEARVNEEAIQGMFSPSRQKHGFAVISDTHFGGYQAQPEFVKSIFQEAEIRGYSFVLHAGDHVDGPPAMHKGFEYELGLTRADDQVDFAAEVYRQCGIPLIGITGNHDGSFFKAAGLDVGRMLQERCDNFIHIGPIQGWVAGPTGDPNFIRLFHPGDGCSYALSYKDQKTAEFLALSDKAAPTGFHFTGHYHKMNHMRGPNGARYFLAPASCATTAFMEAKRLINQAGAYFIEFTLDRFGQVDRVMVEDIRLRREDWVRCDYSKRPSIAVARNVPLWASK